MEVVNLYFDISIHAPREGGDLIVNTITKDCLTNFNPRPPRGGRRSKHSMNFLRDSIISIHAPREGGDSKDAQFYLRIFDK